MQTSGGQNGQIPLTEAHFKNEDGAPLLIIGAAEDQTVASWLDGVHDAPVAAAEQAT